MSDANNSNDTQRRLAEHQQQVADQERANSIKARELMQREQKLKDEQALLEQERNMIQGAQEAIRSSRRQRSVLILPLLLITAVGAGLFAYENLEQQKRYFDQVTQASKSIDRLSQVLSLTQDEVVLTSGKLSNKQMELERTKEMLAELRATTDQLQIEIAQLKGHNEDAIEGKLALTESAGNLSVQLTILREQLEDKYLTNDINEVYIEYQENDLRKAQQALLEKERELAAQRQLIEKQQQRLSALGG